MGIFAEMEKHGHEQVIFFQHKRTKLKGIIAIHDTTAGPALGGCRMRPYATEEEMLFDVFRLSRGMTYKCAIADVDNGGGKCVLLGDPAVDKTPEMFRALGRFVGGSAAVFTRAPMWARIPRILSTPNVRRTVLWASQKSTVAVVIPRFRRHSA